MLRSRKAAKNGSEEFRDYGFGSRASANQRMINRDGSFNVVRRGLPFYKIHGIYHFLITTGWGKFTAIVFLVYLLVNFLFAGVYILIGMHHFQGILGATAVDRFWDAFFFSTQTLATVGYGRINPIGFLANFTAAVESLAGLLAFALATGLLYGRFSRPQAKILFSEKAIIAPYRGITGFEFRVANQRSSQLINVEVQVLFSRNELVDGELKRQFYGLELERDKIGFFPTGWTVVHPITEKSPLRNETPEQLEEGEAEFLIQLKAYDDSFSQDVHARYSYRADELTWGARFVNIFGHTPKGVNTIDLDRVGATEPAELPNTVSVSEEGIIVNG